jgi:hypothetical protein
VGVWFHREEVRGKTVGLWKRRRRRSTVGKRLVKVSSQEQARDLHPPHPALGPGVHHLYKTPLPSPPTAPLTYHTTSPDNKHITTTCHQAEDYLCSVVGVPPLPHIQHSKSLLCQTKPGDLRLTTPPSIQSRPLTQQPRHTSLQPTKMGHSSCPKCGAATDGSSKTCSSCGAVSSTLSLFFPSFQPPLPRGTSGTQAQRERERERHLR